MPKILHLSLLSIALLLPAAQATAEWSSSAPIVIAQRGFSLDDAVRRAQKRGARVLSADVANRNGQRAYRLKLLTRDGKVRIVWVNPKTGRPMNRR